MPPQARSCPPNAVPRAFVSFEKTLSVFSTYDSMKRGDECEHCEPEPEPRRWSSPLPRTSGGAEARLRRSSRLARRSPAASNDACSAVVVGTNAPTFAARPSGPIATNVACERRTGQDEKLSAGSSPNITTSTSSDEPNVRVTHASQVRTWPVRSWFKNCTSSIDTVTGGEAPRWWRCAALNAAKSSCFSSQPPKADPLLFVWFGKIIDVIRVVRPAACVAKVVASLINKNCHAHFYLFIFNSLRNLNYH